MKKVLLISAFLIVVFCNLSGNEKDSLVIPDSSIRFRIISNSDDKTDIQTKLLLKSNLEKSLYPLLISANNKQEANNIITENIDYIEKIIGDTLDNNDFKINHGPNYFPSKIYKGVIYKEGVYDSLVITLGKGYGNNWWCVLFPPLCLLEENNTTEDVTYQLYISRILDKFK